MVKFAVRQVPTLMICIGLCEHSCLVVSHGEERKYAKYVLRDDNNFTDRDYNKKFMD